MRIVVFGAGGAIGSRVAVEALNRGHQVTAVYRGKLDSFEDGRQVTQADARQPSEVLRASRPDAVISAVGAGATGPAPDYDVYVDVARALIQTLREANSAIRLIVVGGAGSLRTRSGARLVETPHFPQAFLEEARAQARALEVYRLVSDVPWTYVSPAAIIESGARSGTFRTGADDLLVDGEGMSRITIEDYACALLDELERPKALSRRMTVAY